MNPDDLMNPGGARWCEQHGWFECTKNRTKGRGPCHKPAIKGTNACLRHSGLSREKAKAKGEVTMAAAERMAKRDDITPSEALLELVQGAAGEVEYWRRRVGELDEAELTWGVTKKVTGGSSGSGGDGNGGGQMTLEAKPHIAYVQKVEAELRLERFASAALQRGVEVELLKIARSRGQVFGGVMQRVLDGVYRGLLESLAGFPEAREAIEGGWPVLVSEVVPRELRALGEEVDS